jgi:putative endonuclease
MSARVLQIALHSLDRLAVALPWTRRDSLPAHLDVGRRGEEAAYFWLRQQGYTMVARNWRTPRRRGEIDLIGWDGAVLCFIEVKTRSQRGLVPAEAAVDADKQHELRAVAAEYLRRLKRSAAHRFDVVSVYCERDMAQVELLKDAFPSSVRDVLQTGHAS